MIHTKAIATIGVMWQDTMPAEFVDSLSQLLLYSQKTLCSPNEFIHYVRAPISWHEMARQHLIENMLGDYILCLDTDHVFAPDLLERLLHLRAKHGTEVLASFYCNKFPPHAPVANAWAEDGKTFHQLLEWDWDAEIMEIGPCGGGGLLINRDTLNRVQKHFGGCFNTIPGLSEDYSFFWRCHELGIKTHLALQCEVHHLTPRKPLSIAGYVGRDRQAKLKVETPVVATLETHPNNPSGPRGDS